MGKLIRIDFALLDKLPKDSKWRTVTELFNEKCYGLTRATFQKKLMCLAKNKLIKSFFITRNNYRFCYDKDVKPFVEQREPPKRRVIQPHKVKCEKKERKCLGCQRVFESEGIHNRICISCKGGVGYHIF